MRFRQVHLDFHTSEHISGIGSSFSKSQFQNMLKKGHVDSITVFSKCHHGWAYHPSKANEIHPELTFDLLGSMIEAAHEINVKTPVYLSAGLDQKLVARHPEWLIRNKEGLADGPPHLKVPGYHPFCMNSPYLDILVSQIEEVVLQYDADGIFLDIVGVRQCYCHNCIAAVREQGLDPRDEAAMQPLWEQTYANYTRRTNEIVHKHKPHLTVFHNGGHITRGRRELARMNTHLELESLPTGGWGYDHFPLSARYAQALGMEYLGMTGKFHTSWGEFGGYKHPNALRYEAALSLANGARCSIGDQLHPSGLMDEATYSLIGAAYEEVEAKEAWCEQARNIADIGVISVEAFYAQYPDKIKNRFNLSDTGAVRILLEGNLLFDVLDMESDFNLYRLLLLPDHIEVDGALQHKLEQYLRSGGKLFASGRSGLNTEGTSFVFDLGAEYIGESPYQPSYFRPEFPIAELPAASYVMYSKALEVALTGTGKSCGARENSYFNRDVFTFCSHQHTPNRPEPAGPAMTEGKDGIYFAWHVFEEYAEKGSLVLKEAVLHALELLLPDRSLRTNLPAQGVVTLQKQDQHNRFIQHLLYASPVRRGKAIEIIEDLIPLYQVEVALRISEQAKRVYLAPSGEELAYTQAEGTLSYTVPKLLCHQMVVIQL